MSGGGEGETGRCRFPMVRFGYAGSTAARTNKLAPDDIQETHRMHLPPTVQGQLGPPLDFYATYKRGSMEYIHAGGIVRISTGPVISGLLL